MAGAKVSNRKTVQKAFHRFVELVKDIPQVCHVVGYDDHDGDIFTLIERRDVGVCKEVLHREYQVMDEFPELEADFHVIYMNDRPLEEFVSPLPGLVFTRSMSDANSH